MQQTSQRRPTSLSHCAQRSAPRSASTAALCVPRRQPRNPAPESGQPAACAAQGLARECAHLLRYVSLNMAAIRKVLHRMADSVAPVAPAPGQLALQISDPHDARWSMLQARPPWPARCVAACGQPVACSSSAMCFLQARCVLRCG